MRMLKSKNICGIWLHNSSNQTCMTTNYIPSSVATKGVKPGGARGAYAPRLFLLRPEIIHIWAQLFLPALRLYVYVHPGFLYQFGASGCNIIEENYPSTTKTSKLAVQNSKSEDSSIMQLPFYSKIYEWLCVTLCSNPSPAEKGPIGPTEARLI